MRRHMTLHNFIKKPVAQTEGHGYKFDSHGMHELKKQWMQGSFYKFLNGAFIYTRPKSQLKATEWLVYGRQWKIIIYASMV